MISFSFFNSGVFCGKSSAKRILQGTQKIFFLLFILSCSKAASVREDSYVKGIFEEYVYCADSTGEMYNVIRKPQRVIVHYTSFLDLWLFTGGNAVGRPDMPGKELSEYVSSIDVTGSVTNPNIEKILSLSPDFVILSNSMNSHRELKTVLSENNIPSMLLDYENYDDFGRIFELFAVINGNDYLIDTFYAEIADEIDSIISETADLEKRSFLSILCSQNSIQCESDITNTAYIASMLGGVNIVDEKISSGRKRASLNLEYITLADPDIIFITPMGRLDRIESVIKNEFASNEAWNSVRAVRDGRVYYLPSELFLNKANDRYPEAFRYIKNIIYPSSKGIL